MPQRHCTPDHHATHATGHANDPELQLFERQVRRFGEDGDCAYERALGKLYRRLFEQRQRQLDALRSAGM
jgi:hypothetical protein